MVGNTEKDGKDTIQQFLELKNVTEEDGGEYACVANNNEGSTYSEPINVDVTCKIPAENIIFDNSTFRTNGFDIGVPDTWSSFLSILLLDFCQQQTLFLFVLGGSLLSSVPYQSPF